MDVVRVALLGSSLLLAVIEAGLQGWPYLTVLLIQSATPTAQERLQHFAPHIVLVDSTTEIPTGSTSALLLRIDATANNQAALVNGQAFPIQQMADLAALVLCAGRHAQAGNHI